MSTPAASRPPTPSRHAQSGVALLVALVMLLLITLIGLAAARSMTLETRMTANQASRELAFQQAEAALRYAEGEIQSGTLSVPAAFQAGTAGLFYVNGAFSSPPQYECISGWANYAGATACGTTTSTAIQYNSAAGNPLPNANVSYIIELLPVASSPGASNAAGNTAIYFPLRITANGVGVDNVSSVRLQSIYNYYGGQQ